MENPDIVDATLWLESNKNSSSIAILVNGLGQPAMRRYPGKHYNEAGTYIMPCLNIRGQTVSLGKLPLIEWSPAIPEIDRPSDPPVWLQDKVRAHLQSFEDCFTAQGLSLIDDSRTIAHKDERAMRLDSVSHRVRLAHNTATAELRLSWNDYSSVTR